MSIPLGKTREEILTIFVGIVEKLPTLASHEFAVSLYDAAPLG